MRAGADSNSLPIQSNPTQPLTLTNSQSRMADQEIPEVLRQKLQNIEGTLRTIARSSSAPTQLQSDEDASKPRQPATKAFETGRFLLWKGLETGFFFVAGATSPGTLFVYNYQNGTENATIHLSHDFGRAAVIGDVIFFPLAVDRPGIVVAVADRSMDRHGDYLAYFSLTTRRLIRCSYIPHQITNVCAILDGSATRSDFERLAEPFHKEWPHILLVGCRYGYVSLVHLDLTAADDEPMARQFLRSTNSPKQGQEQKESASVQPVRCKKNVHLSKIFLEDEMFVFRADDGTTRCQSKDKVFVSALHWLDKSGLAIVGFNFGGIMAVSLRTSKVYSLFWIDGVVQQFAVQEPEEDPRPILYLWTAFSSFTRGCSLLLCNITFPKDEERVTDGQYTYLEPYFMPSMKWNPDNCNRFVTMRTIYGQKSVNSANGGFDTPSMPKFVLNSSGHIIDEKRDSNKEDTSLLFVSWLELARRSETRQHGALFDLNAFYARRLIPKIVPDATVARQIPFIARFSASPSAPNSRSQPLDIMPTCLYRFSPPAFLNESIDQLYYPSTYFLRNNCLSGTTVYQSQVLPIQIQLICHLSEPANIASHFENPSEATKWIHAIGLANSAPSANINEERVCILRVVMHEFFPGIHSLIDASAQRPEWLKFIQKWIWKEVEITKTKFDDLCSPMFATPPLDLSPSANGFIHHARIFFKRASTIFKALQVKVLKFADSEWTQSIIVQEKIARQVSLYSSAIVFALAYHLLPTNSNNSRLYAAVFEQFSRRAEKTRMTEKTLQIHSLVDEIISLTKDQEYEVWQGKGALEWYPPRDFTNFLPIVLMTNIKEAAKLTLLGYYCLDLEQAASGLGSEAPAKDVSTPPSSVLRSNSTGNSCVDSDNDQSGASFVGKKFLEYLLSFLLQEDFSLEERNRIRAVWLSDKDTANANATAQFSLKSSVPDKSELDKTFEKWERLPLSSSGEINKCREEFLKRQWGLHRYNDLVLRRRQFYLLLDVPPLKGNEPEFVQRSHAACLDVQRRFPSLFKKTQTLPEFIVERYKEKVRQVARTQNTFGLPQAADPGQKQLVLPLNIKQGSSCSSEYSAFPPLGQPSAVHLGQEMPSLGLASSTGVAANSTEELYEEMPLTLATPRKPQRMVLYDDSPLLEQDGAAAEVSAAAVPDGQQCSLASTPIVQPSPVACYIVQKGSIKSKDWERISKIVRTPLSLRKKIQQSSRLPIRQRPVDRMRTSSVLGPPNGGDMEPLAGPSSQQNGGVNSTPRIGGTMNPQLADASLVSPAPNVQSMPQPASILKSSDTRLQSRTNSVSKPRLRFSQALFTTEQIPSRAEKALDERHDNSFTNFATLSASESSASSASALKSNSTNFSGGDISSAANSAPPSATSVRPESTTGKPRILPVGIPILSFDDPRVVRQEDAPQNVASIEEVDEDPIKERSFEVQEEEDENEASEPEKEEVPIVGQEANEAGEVDAEAPVNVTPLLLEENQLDGEKEGFFEVHQDVENIEAPVIKQVNETPHSKEHLDEVEKAAAEKAENKQPVKSTSDEWIQAHLRRSTRNKKVPEHFQPDISITHRATPSRSSSPNRSRAQTPTTPKRTQQKSAPKEPASPKRRQRNSVTPPAKTNAKGQERTPPPSTRKRVNPSPAPSTASKQARGSEVPQSAKKKGRQTKEK